MTDAGETDVCQLPTHAQLIGPAETPDPVAQPSGIPLDAIIVPASRPAKSLEAVIDVAREVGCHLVVLCSFRTDPAEARKLLDEKKMTAATVVEVPWDYDHALFDFNTTRWTREGGGKSVCALRNSDLSIKRNIGLALARMLGWNRIFFMDDDIGEFNAAAILGTVSLLGTENPNGDRYHSSGMTVKDFPDNSVVCHARRQIGEYQDVFVSGSVLAVDTGSPFDFFPDVYNEDWFFFYGDAAREQLASSGFNVRQLPYNPFADPLRAASQEFGDVIAEGLYALLHSKLGTESASEEYWRMFLDDRGRILEEILASLPSAPTAMRHEIRAAIIAARGTLREIQPAMCVQYIEAWRSDLGLWRKRLEMLPDVGSVAKALLELQLAPVAQREALLPL